MRVALALLGLALLVALLPGAPGRALSGPAFPPLSGRVVDAAGILAPAEEAAIAAKSEALESATGRQFVVATVPDLQGYDIADYGYQLGRAWGIGEKGRDTGVILIVAPAERRVRIEVGRGLEPVLTDALSRRIIEQAFRPRARAGDLSGAVAAAADAVISHLELPPGEAAARVRAAAEAESEEVPAVVILAFFVLFALFLLLAARSGGRAAARRPATGGPARAGTAGPIIIWGPPHGPRGGWGGAWGSGWGGGGLSGGGFSGGGGDFGGGGASGSW